MTDRSCPFCFPASERIFHAGNLILGVWDAFPVSPGHALLVTRRHIASWFDATLEEQQELTEAIATARSEIERRHTVDGFNIGLNIGAAGGQTVAHLHMHVIPRTTGDVTDPRGGMRLVIPERGNYLHGASVLRDSPGSQAAGSVGEGLNTDLPHDWAPSARRGSPAPHSRPLIIGDRDDPLLPHLLSHLDTARQVDLAVAFILRSGVERIREHLRDLLQRGGHARILTGDYMDVTDPLALRTLLDLAEEARSDAEEPQMATGSLELRIFDTQNQAFHPKVYLFREHDNSGVAYVGSSNLSKSALEEGVEWNYRVVTSRDRVGFDTVASSFEELFEHPKALPLSDEWIDEYERRRVPDRAPRTVGVEAEPAPPTPTPHKIQKEALAELTRTRREGNEAGLVVLATGLGKTWLAAFDSDSSSEFSRVLFVAHREEILAQAMDTFRRIRPDAHLGKFTGTEKTASAEILFASVQTLGREAHLESFDPADFDYIVIDEFHHAAARTYRRILDHFEPKFLLGLTATPDRTDGGDLLGLCGENLVYTCGLARGIELGLLSPFHYFGVPDEVDYTNVPWRSTRFDPESLENALITESRAQNALEQWRGRVGPNAATLAFCCSTKHADYMANFFAGAGVRVAAVHSGPESAPRASSLEKLRDGDLDVVFAVDMFNEGVDIPNIEAILMLRPTESRILWLQQFGRGLRCADGKQRVTVVDYIGNHHVFLNKPIALLGLDGEHRGIQQALETVEAGDFPMPPGCEITYELESIEILRGLLRIPKSEGADALRDWYVEFRERTGGRPSALHAFHAGYAPRAANQRYGSWLGLVREEGNLSETAAALMDTDAGHFLKQLESTPMVKSFKMLVLLALLNADRLPGEIAIDALATSFAKLARRNASLAAEVETDLDDSEALQAYLEKNPIGAWAGGKGTGGTTYFEYDSARFSTTFTVPSEQREPFQELARELVDWRIGEYLARPPAPTAREFRCKVGHSRGSPIIFLPDRTQGNEIPFGTQLVEIDGTPHEAHFVKIAINVVHEEGGDRNVLPAILRRWFGADAGLPGTRFEVQFTTNDAGQLRMEPAGVSTGREGLELWNRYTRAEIPKILGFEIPSNVLNTGVVTKNEFILLFVTLEKKNMAAAHQYDDRFLSPTLFKWQSQTITRQGSPRGKMLRDPAAHEKTIHLFVRPRSKEANATVPFYYCGVPEFLDWEGERPITIRWQLGEAVPEYLRKQLKVPS